MKKCILTITLLVIVLCSSACGREHVDTLTYAVFPYIPDVEYYQEIIEARWAELEPDIKLVRADWDCYYDGMPEGIDVVMYDAVMRDTLIADGCIQAIDPNAVQEAEDIFPYALDGITVQDKLYGIPVFLCGNFLIYDRGSEVLASAEHITDLADESKILVINSENDFNRPQYKYEIIADIRGEANPSIDSSAEEYMSLLDRLADDAHKKDDDTQAALAYDSGIGQGYIGYSESMRLLNSRFDQTGIKAISFSDRENIPRLYVDAAAVTAGVKGKRYEKCLELMNVMAEADVMTALSVQDGEPQYLMLPRKSPYKTLIEQFTLYSELEKLANNEKNHVILTQNEQ